MFELTNQQRECLALPVVHDSWEKLELKPSPHENNTTYVYVEGNKVKKMVRVSEIEYCEYGMDATISDDRTKLLPKKPNGKIVALTASSIANRTRVGMGLTYYETYISLFNANTDQNYYESQYDGVCLHDLRDFIKWVEKWCAETRKEDLLDLAEFAARTRVHVKYREGDFFRFRLNRRLYGYGRIFWDIDQMRKKKIPFWDVFMAKPLCVGIYYISTERKDVLPQELLSLKMMPLHYVMDNAFYYGTYEVIGNLALEDTDADYPIHYGRSTTHKDPRLMYQCGRTWLVLENQAPICPYQDFRFSALGFHLNVKLPVLLECIAQNSNLPFWNQKNRATFTEDLRNPKYEKELREIKKQFGLID